MILDMSGLHHLEITYFVAAILKLLIYQEVPQNVHSTQKARVLFCRWQAKKVVWQLKKITPEARSKKYFSRLTNGVYNDL